MKKSSHLILFSEICCLLYSCGNKQNNNQQAAPPPVPVSVYQVETSNAKYHDEYPATVVAINQVELRPQVNGYVTGIFFKEGSKIIKGQKLYTIDQQQYQANYQAAVANLGVQETNLIKAQKDAERYRELDKHNAIAKQQVDYANAALEAAQKQVEAAKANVRSVQTGVRYATIYAPFNGTIGISQVKLGTAVNAGQTLLNTVSSDDPIAVDITVDQSNIHQFTSLLKNITSSSDSTFTISFSDKDIYPYPGKMDFIDRAVNAQTGTIKLRLLFPNKEHQLIPGMSCTARILNDAQNQIIIPFKAITEQLGEYFIFLVEGGNKVTQRKIKLGPRIGLNAIVMEGLKQGDVIVTEGVQKLREGSAVNTIKPEKNEEKSNKQY
ncbi:efflux RND transporter periplasmic adaptor subunit [Solitalea koreensis]|uniref:Membrane fusion protein, multidrug efflux system n=1 Tax=Solitalea koreensis TaxID=543615 RepID=A0A521CZM5_9SPHI|nr:efflux RND transporter periplasmic adaptor subunit [Solitalea koreensis]SMO64858.1 membrane fusion protein, multidrug efflux system [Solitalea koreensis]